MNALHQPRPTHHLQIATYDYKAAAELNRMLKVLDHLHTSTNQQFLLINIPSKSNTKLQQSETSTNKVYTQLLQQHEALEEIDRRKVDIIDLQEELTKVKENKSKLPYGVILRLENIVRKLQRDLERSVAYKKELKIILERSDSEVKALSHGLKKLSIYEEEVFTKFSNISVQIYKINKELVLKTKYAMLQQQLLKLAKVKDQNSIKQKKIYQSKIIELIELKDQTKNKDIFLGQVTRNLDYQKSIMEQLEELGKQLEDAKKRAPKSYSLVSLDTSNQTEQKNSRSQIASKSQTSSPKKKTEQTQTNPQTSDIELEELKELYQMKLNERTVKNFINLQLKNSAENSLRRLPEHRLQKEVSMKGYDIPNTLSKIKGKSLEDMQSLDIHSLNYHKIENSHQNSHSLTPYSMSNMFRLQSYPNKLFLDQPIDRKHRYKSQETEQKSDDEISLIGVKGKSIQKMPRIRQSTKEENLFPLGYRRL